MNTMKRLSNREPVEKKTGIAAARACRCALTFVTILAWFLLMAHNVVAQPIIIAAISFGASRAGVIAANPATHRVYAAQEDVPAIAVIDGATNTVMATIPTLGYHTGIDVNPVTNRIYVAQQFAGSVRIMDGTTNTVVTDLPVPGSPIHGLAINPATNRLYVIRANSNDVVVFDVAANTLLTAVPVGSEPAGIAINSATNRVYVANRSSANVTVIDGESSAVVTTIAVGSGPARIGVNSTTNRIYVSNYNENTVSVVDGATNAVIATVPVGQGPVGVGVNSAANQIYVANSMNTSDGNSVSVIDGAANTVVATVPVSPQPHSITVIPGANRVYVASDTSHCVSVIEDLPINLPPTVNAGGPYGVNEGGSVVVTASGSDPEGGALIFAWDLDDDGVFEAPGQSVSYSAANLDGPSSRPITVRVADDGGLSATAQTTIDVLNVNPTVRPLTTPIDPVRVNTLVNVSSNFADTGMLDTHTAAWDWGDGDTSDGVISEANGSGSVDGSHTYAIAGVYTVRLTITDKDSGSAQAMYQYVVVYDPGAGLVTGGGWINSPAGAYMPDPLLTGKANFGFVSKYEKGANIPSGQTQFDFKVANLSFHSTEYRWLVVSGARAKYKGSGAINGSLDCGFLLTAIDGQVNGGGGVDKFRVKIWDKITGEIIYDNQIGTPDDADAATPIGGGSIVIHK